MDEDGRHGDEHEDGEGRHVEDEQVKELVVEEADAVVEPRAEVVHLQDATAEHLAKVGAIGLVDVGLGLAAHPPSPVVLHLQRLQLRDKLARLRVLGTDDPRLGDAAWISEDGAHKGEHADEEYGVEHDRVRHARALRADVGRRVVEQRQQDVKGEDKVAPRDEGKDKEHGEPAAELSAGAHCNSFTPSARTRREGEGTGGAAAVATSEASGDALPWGG